MVKYTPELADLITSVCKTMNRARMSLINAAVLRNVKERVSILYSRTRWSGIFAMFTQFGVMRNDLITASDHPCTYLRIDTSVVTQNNVNRYTKNMKHIQHSAKYMQIKKLPLKSCPDSLDMLADDVARFKKDI